MSNPNTEPEEFSHDDLLDASFDLGEYISEEGHELAESTTAVLSGILRMAIAATRPKAEGTGIAAIIAGHRHVASTARSIGAVVTADLHDKTADALECDLPALYAARVPVAPDAVQVDEHDEDPRVVGYAR